MVVWLRSYLFRNLLINAIASNRYRTISKGVGQRSLHVRHPTHSYLPQVQHADWPSKVSSSSRLDLFDKVQTGWRSSVHWSVPYYPAIFNNVRCGCVSIARFTHDRGTSSSTQQSTHALWHRMNGRNHELVLLVFWKHSIGWVDYVERTSISSWPNSHLRITHNAFVSRRHDLLPICRILHPSSHKYEIVQV